jgi:UDP-N-acetylglucosamine 2-epimerase (non-hydrolysing)/GDP/UDP-N,N'-diacetylbacillosamine 2-epimerase (hydrolysing)
MSLIRADADLKLQIIATNMHLSLEFGLTYKEIENDGFTIDKKVEMLLSSDTENAVTKSVGLATIGFADAYDDLKPDLILVLGDRYEILAAVTAALFFKIPVVHLHGGEITEGAFDNSIRHAITKLSHLHFTATEEYRKRVIQMGEAPENVFNVGALGLENIKFMSLLSKKELENSLNFEIGDECVLVTFHPVTLGDKSEEVHMQNLLKALQSIKSLRVIFTLPNSDTNSRIIIKLINNYVEQNNNAISVHSLGQIKYFSALQFVKAVIGNSSSGLIEVPSFGIPTLNIGDRQKGRLRASSVIDCEPVPNDINEKLSSILSTKRKMPYEIFNPYLKPNTANEIIAVLKNIPLENLVRKSFYNL